MASIVADNEFFYIVTLVGFMNICNTRDDYKGKEYSLEKQSKIVAYFNPNKIAINFVFI